MTSKPISVQIEAGLDHVFPFDVEPDCVLVYSFTTTDNVSFCIGYSDDNANQSKQWVKQSHGAFLCPRRGKLVLEFDNSTSWLRGVGLQLTVSLEKPLQKLLEKPICFQLSEKTKLSSAMEKKLFRIKSGSTLTTRDLIDSGRRLLAFDSGKNCVELTGRMVEFGLPMEAKDEDLIARLKGDLRPFLSPIVNGKMARPKIVLGTMTFQDAVNDDVCAAQVKHFEESSPECDEADTAFSYGKSQTIIGRVLTKDYPKIILATKVNCFPTSGKSLSPDSIRDQLERSLKSMNVKKVQICYLHQPDTNTPLEVTLEAMHRLHQEGLFVELGLSNYPAWQVVLAHHICRSRGWVVPTVYQGPYSMLVRDVESELLPALRAHHIRFYAYNPLAGGLLTGKYTSFEDVPKQGRFAGQTAQGKKYMERYWRPSYFQALKLMKQTTDEAELSMVDVSLRWLALHSKLDPARGDAVVLGASTVMHLRQDLASFGHGAPLPTYVAQVADKAWATCRGECPKYFRE